MRSRAAAYYGGGDAPSFTDANRAFGWLIDGDRGVPQPLRRSRWGPPEARWLLLKADDLPRMNSLFRAQMGKNLPILDGRSSQILLASNQLGDHPNESWLSKLVLDDPVPPTAHPLDVDLRGPARGHRLGDRRQVAAASSTAWCPPPRYHLRIYYRVLKPITGTWKSFVHIDGYQRRFNGDHTALDGKYAMNLWHPGDIVVDDFDFQLEPNFTPGAYTVYFGFFAGRYALQGHPRARTTRTASSPACSTCASTLAPREALERLQASRGTSPRRSTRK